MTEKELIEKTKTEQLTELSKYRAQLRKEPWLRFLFFELTLRCNENCIHCGSRCGEVPSDEIPAQVFIDLLDKIANDFKEKRLKTPEFSGIKPRLPMLNITGGEPLLRKEFFDIVSHAHKLGFPWGMTSNGTLITKEVARKLKETGMGTIAISLDGTKEYHDAFRRSKNAFERTAEGIRNLMEQGFQEVQVTTVVTKQNLPQLEEIFKTVCNLEADSWRLLAIEPIGRALENQNMALSLDEHRQMLRYIRDKREEGYPVTYGCCHYLGLDFEHEVRDWYFLCNAGVYTASIMANGDIGACLDIERRPETIQGNVLKNDFTDVWNNRFEIFRTPLSTRCAECGGCPDEPFCEGGSAHSWDYDNNRQMVCFRRKE